MGRKYDTITEPVREFIADQPMFFVATAPLAGDGHVNLSPKGMDTLRVVDANTIIYADLAGSGAETIAHLRENGRITILWCSFGANPRIVRAYGRGDFIYPDDPDFEQFNAYLPYYHGLRSVIRVSVDRVADSCGFGVPEMTLVGQRSRLSEWAERRTADEIQQYMSKNNTVSIDGLPAWEG